MATDALRHLEQLHRDVVTLKRMVGVNVVLAGIALVLVLLLTAACGGSSPVTPAPTPTPPPAPPPPAPLIEVQTCPTAPIVGFTLDLGFYRQIACNAFDEPMFLAPVRRWLQAPRLYILTADDAGAAIDPATLDTVQRAMTEAAPMLTNGRFSLASVERGADTRQVGVRGVISVSWLSSPLPNICGQERIAVESGLIELNYKGANCGCNGSAIRPHTARHELGHALGYYHTDSVNDLMSGLPVSRCDGTPSAREQQAIAYHYR